MYWYIQAGRFIRHASQMATGCDMKISICGHEAFLRAHPAQEQHLRGLCGTVPDCIN